MEEYFDVINEKNEVIGKASRDECHRKGLMHRGVFIIIVGSGKKILLQKRSMHKDLHPGLWTTSVSGHVDSGEDYEKAAKREMSEEIGIHPELEELFTSPFKDISSGRIDYELDKIYFARHDGPFQIDEEEVEKVDFFSLDKIDKMINKGMLTPPSAEIFRRIISDMKLLKSLGLS